ncbi:MAG: MFS transporter [Arachnia sp.]
MTESTHPSAGGPHQDQARAAGSGSAILARQVNLGKLLLLAAMVPASVVGIAQRASALGEPQASATVALASALGSLCAVIGALGGGYAADLSSGGQRHRWSTVAACSAVGAIGIATMMTAGTATLLIAGWALTQLGCSGGMAVLRALLAAAEPTQRRRGASVMVLTSYLGAGLPLAVLYVWPGSVWSSSLALVGLALALAVLIAGGKPATSGPAPAVPVAVAADPSPSRQAMRWPVLLAVQFAANVVLSAYLSFHSLEVAHRIGGTWTDAVTQLSVLALAAAVAGLVLAASVFWWRPGLLAQPAQLLVIGGIVLAGSVFARPWVSSPVALLMVLMISGAAVGVNSVTLLTATLATTTIRSSGRVLGAYSAAGAGGQFVGPLVAWWLVRLSPGGHDYGFVLWAVAVLPAVWAAGIAGMALRQRRGGPQRLD